MSFQIGDPIFNHLGLPGRVVESDSDTPKPDQVKVDQEFAAVQTEFRHGYIKGLNPNSRQELYEILDEVAGIEDVGEKVAMLQAKIGEYEAEVSHHSRHMLGYLKAELAHLMNSRNYSPRFYEIPVSRAP